MPKSLGGKLMYYPYKRTTPSRHLTVVFNVFVLFQVFNMLAARKIHDEKNILEGVFGNAMFVGVWIVIAFGQYVMCQFGGSFMKVHTNGLTGEQWGLCAVVALTGLAWNFVLKFCPETCCPRMGDEDQDEVAAAEKDYQQLRFRKRRDLSNSARQGNFIQNKH
jgi:magnesium-transporting ATPase (P-type)